MTRLTPREVARPLRLPGRDSSRPSVPRASKPRAARSTRRRAGGQSLVEFALLVPLLFLLIVNAVNFGGFFYAWITIANAARVGAQYTVMAGATVQSPKPPTAAQVYNLIQADVSALPGAGSLVVRSCTNNDGTINCTTTGSGSFPDPPADARPEASLYVMSWTDVRYTYQPFIPLFSFPGLGLYATLPPTTIHRQAVMRMIQ